MLSFRQSPLRRTVTYAVACPRDLSPEASTALMRSLSGLLQADRSAVVSFEVVANHHGLTFLITFDEHLAATGQRLVITQLGGSHLSRLAPAEDPLLTTNWQRGLELKVTNPRLPLRFVSAAPAIAGLLSAFTGLRPGEALAQQWILSGATAVRPPASEHKDDARGRPPDQTLQRKKAEEPQLRAVGRLAAAGPDPASLLHRLHGPYAALSAPGVQVKQRPVPSTTALVRLRCRAAGATTRLSASEATVVIGLPVGRPGTPGLPLVRSRQLPADPIIPSNELVVARSTYPGSERPMGFRAQDLAKHVHLMGKNGVGKSTLMVNLLHQQIAAGYGAALIDPTGDTAEDLLARIPAHRLGDVVVFDPTDIDFPVGFNIFDGTGDPEVTADQLMGIFHGIYRDTGIMTSNYLRAALQSLASVPGQTLVEVVPMLLDPGYRARIVRQLSDPMLIDLWQRFDQMRPSDQLQSVRPALHRVQPLLLRRSVRLTLGQADTRLDLAQVLRDRKILVANLPKGRLGEETAALHASLLFARLWQAAMARPRHDRHPFFVHVDEVHGALHANAALDVVLAEARKFGLGMTLAHQHMQQLPAHLRAAIQANTRTKAFFAVSADDAYVAARELGAVVEAGDLVALGKYECIVQTVVDDATSTPASARTLPPVPVCSEPTRIREASRRKFARPAAEVEAAILVRHRSQQTAGDRGWQEA